jgi:hypothetical protein
LQPSAADFGVPLPTHSRPLPAPDRLRYDTAGPNDCRNGPTLGEAASPLFLLFLQEIISGR